MRWVCQMQQHCVAAIIIIKNINISISRLHCRKNIYVRSLGYVIVVAIPDLRGSRKTGKDKREKTGWPANVPVWLDTQPCGNKQFLRNFSELQGRSNHDWSTY